MTTFIVFSCNSNTCRSQMAEGWATEWIKAEKAFLSQQLISFAPISTNLSQSDDNLDEEKCRDLRKRLHRIDRFRICSVALDTNAIYIDRSRQDVQPNVDSMCCGDKCSTNLERKNVKGKAIDAMAKLGVDISSYKPKSIDDVLSSLWEKTEGGDSKEEDASEKPIDYLIILCGCSATCKEDIVRLSNHVEEWNIDAPTEAAKDGEGDGAYIRVSLDIKQKVTQLMDELSRSLL